MGFRVMDLPGGHAPHREGEHRAELRGAEGGEGAFDAQHLRESQGHAARREGAGGCGVDGPGRLARALTEVQGLRFRVLGLGFRSQD